MNLNLFLIIPLSRCHNTGHFVECGKTGASGTPLSRPSVILATVLWDFHISIVLR